MTLYFCILFKGNYVESGEYFYHASGAIDDYDYGTDGTGDYYYSPGEDAEEGDDAEDLQAEEYEYAPRKPEYYYSHYILSI